MSRARDLADAGSKANYLDNVTANIPADVDGTYALKASPIFTGTSTFADLKATAIKHTNGTSAITINSDGSLSGKFEGAVKFVQIGRPSSTNPTDTNKVWITFGITSGYHANTSTSNYLTQGFGQPCAVNIYSSGSWSWTYLNQSISSGTAYGALSASSPTTGGTGGGEIYTTHGFTYTIEMDKV